MVPYFNGRNSKLISLWSLKLMEEIVDFNTKPLCRMC